MNANTALKINDAIDQAIRCGESVSAVKEQVRKALERSVEEHILGPLRDEARDALDDSR